jgi:tRNA G18 (ribose-2'-O)-methylase SpoU
MKYSVLLHNIRSVYNVGSIFRTADAAGFDHVYISGYTPTPIDRFGRARNDLSKVALGSEKTVPWSSFTTIDEALEKLKQQNAHLLAVEQSDTSFDYRALKDNKSIKDEVVIIMGEETRGIELDVLNRVDATVEIPMRGDKESLNVSVAFGIIAYEITKTQ